MSLLESQAINSLGKATSFCGAGSSFDDNIDNISASGLIWSVKLC